MFIAYLEDKSVWQPVLWNHVLRKSLDWLGEYAQHADFGDYQIGKHNWSANVHGYSTLPESVAGKTISILSIYSI